MREPWLLDLAMEDGRLQTQGSILCDEFGLAAREVDRCGEDNRMAKGQGEVKESHIQRRRCGAYEPDIGVVKERHGEGSLERLQNPSREWIACPIQLYFHCDWSVGMGAARSEGIVKKIRAQVALSRKQESRGADPGSLRGGEEETHPSTVKVARNPRHCLSFALRFPCESPAGPPWRPFLGWLQARPPTPAGRAGLGRRGFREAAGRTSARRDKKKAQARAEIAIFAGGNFPADEEGPPSLFRADQRPAEIAFNGVRVNPSSLAAMDGPPALGTVGGQAGALPRAGNSRNGGRPNLVPELRFQGVGRTAHALGGELARDVGVEDRRPPEHLVLEKHRQRCPRLIKGPLLILAVRVGMAGHCVQIGGPAGMVGRFQFLGQRGEQGGGLIRMTAGEQLVGMAQCLLLGRAQRDSDKGAVSKRSEYGSTSCNCSVWLAPGRQVLRLGQTAWAPGDVQDCPAAPRPQRPVMACQRSAEAPG